MNSRRLKHALVVGHEPALPTFHGRMHVMEKTSGLARLRLKKVLLRRKAASLSQSLLMAADGCASFRTYRTVALANWASFGFFVYSW